MTPAWITSSGDYGNGTNERCAYNGLGQRVYYQDGGGRTHYNGFDGAEPGALLLSDNYAVFTPGISEHHSGTGSLFYNNDALGSPRSIVNASSVMTDDERFDGFGSTQEDINFAGNALAPRRVL